MNVERLKELIVLLETIPAANFSLAEWTYAQGIENKSQEKLIQCGTICCAVGWACSHPPFVKQGLHWSATEIPTFKNFDNWSAVENFFDISEGVAQYLFSIDTYPDDDEQIHPSDVIERIKEIMEDEDLYNHLSNEDD